MNKAAKIGLVVGGAVTLTVIILTAGKAKASPGVLPSVDLDESGPPPPPQGGLIVVPEHGEPHPSVPPVVVPLPPLTVPLGGVPFVPPSAQPPLAPPVLPPPFKTDLPPIPMVIDPRLVQLPPLVVTSSDPAAPPLVVPPVATAASRVPEDTAALAQKMLADEATGKWKTKLPQIGAWQAARGMKADQEFGPGSARRMALEIGTLPIVRYWPKGSFKEGHWLRDYQQALLELAAAAPEPRKSQLKLAAERERGQGFGSQQLPIGVRIVLG